METPVSVRSDGDRGVGVVANENEGKGMRLVTWGVTERGIYTRAGERGRK